MQPIQAMTVAMPRQNQYFAVSFSLCMIFPMKGGGGLEERPKYSVKDIRSQSSRISKRVCEKARAQTQ
jgi:hypothetical protein